MTDDALCAGLEARANRIRELDYKVAQLDEKLGDFARKHAEQREEIARLKEEAAHAQTCWEGLCDDERKAEAERDEALAEHEAMFAAAEKFVRERDEAREEIAALKRIVCDNDIRVANISGEANEWQGRCAWLATKLADFSIGGEDKPAWERKAAAHWRDLTSANKALREEVRALKADAQKWREQEARIDDQNRGRAAELRRQADKLDAARAKGKE